MNQKHNYPLLINKHVPESFQDFNGNPSMIRLLSNQISLNKIQTLIVGEECVGKTTLINVIIKEYYGHTVNKATYKSNVLYIHYLKEQGISYYKNEVKYFCQTYCGIPGKKKIIVLDDLDMLTETNQTIFINIIDKYSDQVHFIASCKSLQKVLYGIQSRLIIMLLHSPTPEHLMATANRIIQEEGMTIDENALPLLISVSKNKMNRLINYIDKIKLIRPSIITHEVVLQLCTNIQYDLYKKYFERAIEGNHTEAIDVLYGLYDSGFSVIDILENMFEYVKLFNMEGMNSMDPFFVNINETHLYEITQIICKYITYFYNIHEDEIELAIITNNIISLLYISINHT